MHNNLVFALQMGVLVFDRLYSSVYSVAQILVLALVEYVSNFNRLP